MKVLSIISQKGGVGKTTLATALGVQAARAGLRTVLLDLDPQASATFWSDNRSGDDLGVTALPPARLAHVIAAAREGAADLAIVDTPPFAKDIAFDAAAVADLVLIPTKPAVLDIVAMSRTAELLRTFRKRAGVVLTFCPPVGREIEDAEEAARQMEMDVCPVRIGNRIAFSRAQQHGQAAQEFEPDGKAASEIQQLYQYACLHLWRDENAQDVDEASEQGPQRAPGRSLQGRAA